MSLCVEGELSLHQLCPYLGWLCHSLTLYGWVGVVIWVGGWVGVAWSGNLDAHQTPEIAHPME